MEKKKRNSLMCKMFGHKYVHHVMSSVGFLMGTYSNELKEPICIRCGDKPLSNN